MPRISTQATAAIVTIILALFASCALPAPAPGGTIAFAPLA